MADTPEQKQRERDAGFLLMRLILMALAAWVLMLTEALVDKETGVPGGNFGYLTCLGIVGVIFLVSASKRPLTALRS